MILEAYNHATISRTINIGVFFRKLTGYEIIDLETRLVARSLDPRLSLVENRIAAQGRLQAAVATFKAQ